MPAKSKQQQRLFGMVHAYQKGELKNASKEVKDIAKTISKKDAKDFAETKHKGLPNKVKKSAKKLTESQLRKIISETIKSVLNETLGASNEAPRHRIVNKEQYRTFREAVDWAKNYVLNHKEAPDQSLQKFYYKQGYDYKYSFDGLAEAVSRIYSDQSIEFARKAVARAIKELDDENKLHDFRK